MEACEGSHFLGRPLREQGHELRVMPAQYVKSYGKTNKSDYIDAEAIAEAVGRPKMRFRLHIVSTNARNVSLRTSHPPYLCNKSTGAVTSCTRKYLASAGYFRATASYIAYATLR